MAINMKRLTDKARAKVENEKKDEERKSLLAQGQGPRVSRQEAEQAWQRQKAEKATQEKTTTKTGQSPFRTREEALMALKKQKEQTQSQTTATKAVASAVKPTDATAGVKPTLTPVEPAGAKDAKAVTEWYTQNSEKAKEKAWKEQRSWEDQRSRIQPVMDAFAARDAGQTLTPEQQVTIDNYDYEEIKAGWDEANAEISRLQKVTGVESAMAQGYGSIKDERAERYKGAVSDVEANAAQMIGSGQMGEWSQMWQREMDAATSKRDELAADLDILKNTGADKDVIAEQEERLGWLNEDVQALTDVSVLAQPDFAQLSQPMEGVSDLTYRSVNGEPLPAWAQMSDMAGQLSKEAEDAILYEQMTDQERGIFNYLFNSDAQEGRQNAYAYLDRIKDRLQYRKVQAETDVYEEMADELPVTSTVARSLAQPVEALSALPAGVAALMGAEMNPYSDVFGATRFRQSVAETVNEKIGSPLGQFAYGVGTSIADVGVASVLGGGNAKLSSLLMALPAGASTGMEMLEQGADSNTALLGGAGAAAAEWATERLGFERLYGSFTSGKMAGTYKDMLKAAVTGFFAEGSEEAASAVANEAIDRWLMGDNSQRVQQIRQGMENGLSVDEAIREADWSLVKTIGENFLAGGVAGGLMQGGSYAAGMVNANAATQQIVEELPEVNRELVQAAMEMEAGVRTMDEAVVEEAYAQIEAEQEKQVEQQNHAVFAAPAQVKGVQGAVSGVQKSGEGAQVLVKQAGKEIAVPLSEVRFQNEEQRQAYGYATAYADDETARQFLAGYERTNAPIRNYARGFEAAYAAGRNSRQLMGAEKVWAKAVPDAIRQMAYEAGQKSAAAEDARLEMDADVDAAIARSVQKIPRMVTEEYTGAVNQVRRSKITKSQATQMAMLDSLGKKYGTQYIFVDSFQETQAANQHLGAAAASVQNGRINGVYKAGTNQMVIALDAEGGNLLRAAGHESWHYIKEHSQKNDYVRGDADALQGFVLEKLQGVEDYDLETRIAQKQDQYKRMAGQELDRNAAVEEIVADSLVEVLATEQNVRDLMEQHTTLGEKVMGFIKRFLGDIRATLRKMGGKNAEARAMLEQDEKTLQQIADHFDRVMIEVNAVRGSGSAAQSGGGVKYSLVDSDGNKIELADNELEENKRIISTMDNVSHAAGNNFVNLDGAAYRKAVQSYFDGVGRTAENPVIGTVRITTSGLKHLTRYKSKLKSALVPCVRDVIENGLIVDIDDNHDMRGEPTVVLAAPVELDGKGYYMGVAVRQANNLDKLYHIHEAAMIEQEKDDHPATKTEPLMAEPSPDDHPSIYSILDSIRKYNKKNAAGKNEFSLSDVEEASQTNTAAFKQWFGDSEVVNEDGSPKVMYHGTATEFWAFDKRKANDLTGRRLGLGAGKGKFYLTEYRGSANAAAYSAQGRGNGKNPKVMELYVSAQKVMDRAVYDRLLQEEYKKHPNSEPHQMGYDYRARDKAIAAVDRSIQKAGYDGVWDHDSGEMFVFEATQIKSAVKNIGTYNPKNPDIRYSLRDVDATNTTMETLLEENRALRDTVRALNQQLKGEARQLDEKTVRRVASGLKKKYASTVPLNTLTENLTRAFNAMQSAENTRQSEAAMEMMGNIALDMIQKSQIADREAYDASRDLRERFRKHRIGLTDTQWQEAESLYDTARDFRRAVFGKWNVPAQNGRGVTTLDMIWDDLVAEYPQYFSADASEGDMVQQVLAMLDATAIKYENPFGAEIEQVASGVATEIYQEYLGAGRETGSKNAAVDKLMDQLADAKKTILEQKRGLRRANRDIADMRAKREAQALRRKQNQDYNQVKNEIIRKKGQLLKKLEAPKSGAFIPASMYDAVHELLKAIDFEGKLGGETNKPLTHEMLDRARDEYKKLNLPDENGGTGPLAAFYNGDLEHDFNLLAVEADGLRAKELSMKHMQSLRNIVAGYAAAIINEDRMFMQNRKESLQATGDDLLLSMSTRWEHTVQGGVKKWFSDGLQQGLLKPVTVFHQFKGTAMEPVWKALRNAEGKHIRHVEEGAAYLEEALGKYDQHESIRKEGTKAKRDKAKEITFDNGTKMKLTDQEMMTLYATARREQLVGTQHLMKGGFTLANAPKGSSLRPVILTAKDIQTITESLTQQQREYVDHMVEYLSGTCADWGNEVTMELYGVEKFHEEYYIPFSVNKNYVSNDPSQSQDNRIKTGSFTKALTANASNPLVIIPFTELWCQHVEKMSDYNAFVLPIEDMTRLMNYKGEGDGVKATMNRAYGKQTTDYIMHFLRRLNGNSRNEMGESWLGGFMGRAKGAAVTFNLSVAIQQAGSAPRAMAMIDPRHFMSGLAKAFAHGKVDNHRAIGAAYAELEKYAPIAVEKGWGYFDTNMSRGMYQRAQNTTMNKINDAGGFLAEWGDKITWAIIWEAVKSETADTYKEVMVGSEEYYQLCADRFQDVIDHTQVVDSIFQRAEFAAEKGMMKNFMAFISEPLTTYNMIYRAIWDIAQASRDGKGKARAWGRLGRTFTAFAVSSALTAAFKSVVMALRDRDNEKKDEEGNIIGVRDYGDIYLESLPGAVLDNLLGVGTVFTNAISDAMSGFGGGSDLTTGWIGNLGTGCKQMFDMLTGNRDSNLENWEKAMYKMLQGSSSVVGIGFGNLWRDVKSIGLTAYEIVERDSLAGTAWDKTVPFKTRLAAAQKNYVYKKQPGDNRKQNTGIYYDLMLTAYFEDGGLYENYEAAADAAIATGATYKNLVTAFKSRLRVAEDKIPQAAKALVDGNMETYQRCIEELQETGIGLRPICSMVLGEVRELLPQDEEGPGSGEDVVAEMQREDVDEDPVKYVQNYAYNRATTPQELKAAIDTMRKSGMNDDELRKKVTNSYRKTYCLAIWEGDAAAAKNAADMMKGAGVGIADDDLVDWTSGLTGSYASDTLHDMIKEGDGKTAVKIRAAMYKAHGQTKTNDAIESYVKRYCVGKENVDGTNVKKALLALGYSQATIESWYKK